MLVYSSAPSKHGEFILCPLQGQGLILCPLQECGGFIPGFFFPLPPSSSGVHPLPLQGWGFIPLPLPSTGRFYSWFIPLPLQARGVHPLPPSRTGFLFLCPFQVQGFILCPLQAQRFILCPFQGRGRFHSCFIPLPPPNSGVLFLFCTMVRAAAPFPAQLPVWGAGVAAPNVGCADTPLPPLCYSSTARTNSPRNTLFFTILIHNSITFCCSVALQVSPIKPKTQ